MCGRPLVAADPTQAGLTETIMLTFMLANLILSIVVLGGLFGTVRLAMRVASDRGRGGERPDAGRAFARSVARAA